ncbi:MAG: DUF1566 domain-containing protein, partial [Nitrospirae bacterium]|nr:DUF1566 domain-containing protein [Nitrospirota bacterium]
GDDGSLKKGVVWPDPRFTDNGDKTVTDNLTGLVWTKSADTPTVGSCTGGKMTWQKALDYVKCLNTSKYLGQNDWRLPNRKELFSLIDRGSTSPAIMLNYPFVNVQLDFYWSSNTNTSGAPTYPPLNALGVSMIDGGVYNGKKTDSVGYAWPVRGDSTASPTPAPTPTPTPAPIGIVSLPRTGQVRCWDESGNVIDCAGTGQDGELRKGVVWPAHPRFTDNGDNTMTDRLTGLMWPKDAGSPTVGSCKGPDEYSQFSLKMALDYVDCLNTAKYLGQNDWRLPNIVELESLVNAEYGSQSSTWLPSQGFLNVYWGNYASSTTNASDTSTSWTVFMQEAGVYNTWNISFMKVWPVRGGDAGAAGNAYTWATGQRTSYYKGDDGSLQKGVAWPLTRFSDNGDKTVTDNLTWLVWNKSADTPTVGSCAGGKMTWQKALDYVKCLNTSKYLGQNDWRLPNRKELFSLIDHGSASPAIAVGHPFLNVQLDFYWSSNTNTYQSETYPPLKALGVSMIDGGVYNGKKTDSVGYVWPVRTGSGAGPAPTPTPTPGGKHVSYDFNGDGMSDIILRSTSTGAIYIWIMNGNGIATSSSGWVVQGLSSDWQIKGIGDFDSNGKADILLQNINSGDVVIWFMNGANAPSSGSYVTKALPLQWKIIAVGDFNGDGKADVVLQDSASGDVVIWLMDGANRSFGDYAIKGMPSNWVLIGVGDLNGDGKADMIWQDSKTGDVAALTMDGTKRLSGDYVELGIPGNWKIMAISDFNGDGKADILWQETASGDVAMWLMNGPHWTSANYVQQGIKGWQIKAIGDYNGDGKSDIVLQNSTTGDVVVWFMDGLKISGGNFVVHGLPADWQVK